MTIDEIAQVANVSKTTISRVLNNKPDVNPETRKFVWDIIKRHGYQPNAGARAMAQNRANNIGLIIPYNTVHAFLNPINVEILRGICDKIEKRNYYLVMCYPQANNYVNIYKQKRVDGFILMDPCLEHNQLVEYMLQEKVPFVSTAEIEEFPQVASVSADNYAGARCATEHLIEAGHKNIAFICKETYVSSKRRLEGYHDAHEAAGLHLRAGYVKLCEMATEEDGYRMACQLFECSEPPTAVFAACDILALGVLKACRERSIRVPQDVSVVGFDDLVILDYIHPPLTTVHQPAFEMGSMAAEKIVEYIEKGERPESEQLPIKLIKRGSSGEARTDGVRSAQPAEATLSGETPREDLPPPLFRQKHPFACRT
jgi:LacI family transcriptional regulator